MNTYTKRISKFIKVVECLEIGANNHGWVDVSVQETFNCGEDLSCKNDDRGGTVSSLLVLSSAKLNHRLGSWVSDINLKEFKY